MSAHDNPHEAVQKTGDQGAGKSHDHVEQVARTNFLDQVLNTVWNDPMRADKAYHMVDKAGGGVDAKDGKLNMGNVRDLYMAGKSTGQEGFQHTADGRADNERRREEQASIAGRAGADAWLDQAVSGKKPELNFEDNKQLSFQNNPELSYQNNPHLRFAA